MSHDCLDNRKHTPTLFEFLQNISYSAYTTDAVSKQKQIKKAKLFNEMTKSKPIKTYLMFEDFTVYPAYKHYPTYK